MIVGMGSKPRIETLAVHAGQTVDPASGAVVLPIHLSTTFERDRDGEYSKGFSYSRDNNPNRASLETCLAALEGGQQALAFSSGLAVVTAVLQSLKPGDHVLAPDDVYHGFRRVAGEVFANWRLSVSYADMSDAGSVENAIQPNTALIWIETPSNPLLKITDLAAIAAIAKQKKIPTVCDGTFASPVLQHPLEFGIDMVAHSTTKYIAGHSDVTGGVLICREENPCFESARRSQRVGGSVPSPFDCWLTLRGIATLPIRVRAQSESAAKIADFLLAHANVEAVHYPGLKSHPGHTVAARQMSLFGGMLSFQVKGNAEDAMRLAASTQIFTRATSLGGAHSLIEHRASVEGPNTKTPRNLLRLSIGLENTADLIEDLEAALATVSPA
jgi:cystathionine gamma-synthase